MIDVFSKTLESRFRFRSGSLRRRSPKFARRVCAASEIDSVPKLFMYPLAGVIKNADETPALAAHAISNGRNLVSRRIESVGSVQVHAGVIAPHVVNGQSARVPKWFFVQSHVRALVHIARDAVGSHADRLQPGHGLRPPGGSRLA